MCVTPVIAEERKRLLSREVLSNPIRSNPLKLRRKCTTASVSRGSGNSEKNNMGARTIWFCDCRAVDDCKIEFDPHRRVFF